MSSTIEKNPPFKVQILIISSYLNLWETNWKKKKDFNSDLKIKMKISYFILESVRLVVRISLFIKKNIIAKVKIKIWE